jgi:hypothetical protein
LPLLELSTSETPLSAGDGGNEPESRVKEKITKLITFNLNQLRISQNILVRFIFNGHLVEWQKGIFISISHSALDGR